MPTAHSVKKFCMPLGPPLYNNGNLPKRLYVFVQ